MSFPDWLTEIDGLNAATKYPAIPTYHSQDSTGRPSSPVLVPFDPKDPPIVTEMINGASVRIVMLGNFYFFGGRKEFLYASGDILHQSTGGIVDTLRPLFNSGVAAETCRYVRAECCVVYGEVYGLKSLPGFLSYGNGRSSGFRVFDIATFEPGEISRVIEGGGVDAWRDRGGQTFLSEDQLQAVTEDLGFGELVPRLAAPPLPIDPSDTHGWLQDTLQCCEKHGIPETRAPLGEPLKMPEGVVIRTPTRDRIAKIRWDDYYSLSAESILEAGARLGVEA